MAQKAVDSNATQEKPKVVVRKRNSQAVPAKKEAQDPAQSKQKAVPKKAAPKPKKMPPQSYEVIFREKYLNDVRQAASNAASRLADESRSDREYYAAKSRFLNVFVPLIESNDATDASDFDAALEPFFWNEFKRISDIISSGPKVSGEHRRQISPAWRRAGNKLGRQIAGYMNKVREARDGFVLKTAPVTVTGPLCSIMGAMMHLERQIEADSKREDLPKLLDLYKEVFVKSGMKLQMTKLVANVKKTGWRGFWKNDETVDYLLTYDSRAKAPDKRPAHN